MISASEQIGRLQALLERIQRRAAAPRVPPVSTRPVTIEPEPPTVASYAPPPPEAYREPEVQPAELEDLAPEDLVAEPPEEAAQPIEAPSEPVIEAAAEEPIPEARTEAISGEFAVAEAPMELEELGPADDLEPDEHVVEIHIDEPQLLVPVVEEPPAAQDFVAENLAEERLSEPPESGRELVSAPHESARMAVAVPATPEPNLLETLAAASAAEQPFEEEPIPPPESSRSIRAVPAVGSTSDVIALEPSFLEPPEPSPMQPVVEPVSAEPPPEPQQVAIAVALSAPGAGAARPIEHVVVSVEADVIRPEITPAEVAAFIGAVRAPRPETFGVLLDAALDL